MDELHHNILKEQEKEAVLKGYATSHGVSIGSLRASHLAPSAHQSPRGAVPPTSPQRTTQFYNLTPPVSPRNLTSSFQQSSTNIPPEPVVPDEQRHYSHIPHAPKRSKTKKLSKTKYTGGRTYKIGKFHKMTDTDLDDKIDEQHQMDVDDAEMQQKQVEIKRNGFNETISRFNG
jgi:hypothetical protein